MECFAVLTDADGSLADYEQDLCFFPGADLALWNRLGPGAREFLQLHYLPNFRSVFPIVDMRQEECLDAVVVRSRFSKSACVQGMCQPARSGCVMSLSDSGT